MSVLVVLTSSIVERRCIRPLVAVPQQSTKICVVPIRSRVLVKQVQVSGVLFAIEELLDLPFFGVHTTQSTMSETESIFGTKTKIHIQTNAKSSLLMLMPVQHLCRPSGA